MFRVGRCMCVHCVNCSEQAKKEAEQKRKEIQAKLAMSQSPTVSQYLFHCVYTCTSMCNALCVHLRCTHNTYMYDSIFKSCI